MLAPQPPQPPSPTSLAHTYIYTQIVVCYVPFREIICYVKIFIGRKNGEPQNCVALALSLSVDIFSTNNMRFSDGIFTKICTPSSRVWLKCVLRHVFLFISTLNHPFPHGGGQPNSYRILLSLRFAISSTGAGKYLNRIY